MYLAATTTPATISIDEEARPPGGHSCSIVAPWVLSRCSSLETARQVELPVRCLAVVGGFSEASAERAGHTSLSGGAIVIFHELRISALPARTESGIPAPYPATTPECCLAIFKCGATSCARAFAGVGALRRRLRPGDHGDRATGVEQQVLVHPLVPHAGSSPVLAVAVCV